MRSLSILVCALLASGCAGNVELLARDPNGLVAFGTVERAWDRPGDAERRLEKSAQSWCGGDYGMSYYPSGPPGELAPLEVPPARKGTAQHSFRRDHAEYGVVGCRSTTSKDAGAVPVVALTKPYTAVSPDREPVDEGAVTFIVGHDAAALPPSGIVKLSTSRLPNEERHLAPEMLEKYPTAENPDRWMGYFELGPLGTPEQAKRVAAARGANVVVQPVAKVPLFHAFYVSSSFPTADALVQQLTPEGFRAGPRETGSLGDKATVTFDGVFGQCYAIVGAVEADATTTTRRMPFTRATEKGAFAPAERLYQHVPGQRSFIAEFGCPAENGKIGVDVDWPALKGEGRWVLTLISRAASAKTREELDTYRTLEACNACKESRASCLSKRGVSEAQCTTAYRSERPNVGGLTGGGAQRRIQK